MQKYLLIAFGGAFGSVARYWVGSTIAGRMGTRFPFGTFVINLTACIIIGFSLTYLGKRTGMDPAWRFLIRGGLHRRVQHFFHLRVGDAFDAALGGICAGGALRRGQPGSGIDGHLVRAALAEAIS